MVDFPTPVSSDYVSQNQTKIKVAHKVGVGNYAINDSEGEPLFDVKGPAFVGRDVRRLLCDASGNQLVLLKNKVSSWHDRWYAYRGTDDSEESLLFSMGKCSVFQITPCFEIFLPTNKTSEPDFLVKGNFRERNYKIYFRSYAIVAEAKKRFSIAYPVAIGKDHYTVTLNPGVDRAFIASVVVIINEVKEDKRRELKHY